MFRRHSSSACVHFVKPTLEALEDRTLLSQLGNLMSAYSQHVATLTLGMILPATNAASDMVSVASTKSGHDPVYPNPDSLQALLNGTLILQNAANFMQQQAQFLNNAIQLGIQNHLLDPGEIAHLKIGASVFAEHAIVWQNEATKAQNELISEAITFVNDVGLGLQSASGGSFFDALAGDVVGGIVL